MNRKEVRKDSLKQVCNFKEKNFSMKLKTARFIKTFPSVVDSKLSVTVFLRAHFVFNQST